MSDERPATLTTTTGGSRRRAPDVLPAQIADRVAATVPPNTRRCWQTRWRRYTQWCDDTGRTPLPASSAQLAEFVRYLDSQGLRPKTLDSYLASLLAVMRLCAQPPADSEPGTDAGPPDAGAARAFITECALDAPAPRRATALYPPEIRAIIDAMGPDSHGYLRDRALILLAYALGRRGAQIAAIDLPQVREHTDGSISVLLPAGAHMRRAGRGEYVTVPAAADRRYCPAAAVHAWRDALDAQGYQGAALFPRIDQGGRLGAAASGPARARADDDGRITPETVDRIVRVRAAAAGLTTPDPDPNERKITTHSLRRGFLATAFSRGADPVELARHAGFAEGSPLLPGYVEPGTGWNRNPATGILDEH